MGIISMPYDWHPSWFHDANHHVPLFLFSPNKTAQQWGDYESLSFVMLCPNRTNKLFVSTLNDWQDSALHSDNIIHHITVSNNSHAHIQLYDFCGADSSCPEGKSHRWFMDSSDSETFAESKWRELCIQLGVTDTMTCKWWEFIRNHYAESWRHFHTIAHVSDMMKLLAQHEQHIRNSKEVAMAIYFHE